MGKLLFRIMLCAALAVLCIGCKDKDPVDDEPVILPTINPLAATLDQFNLPVVFLGNAQNDLIQALNKRKGNVLHSEPEQPELIFVSQSEISQFEERIIEAYAAGDFIAVVHPDYGQIRSTFASHGMKVLLPSFETPSSNMLVCFNCKGSSYSVDDPFDGNEITGKQESVLLSDGSQTIVSGSDDVSDYLNPFVRFINESAAELVTKADPADVEKTFDAQKVEHTYTIHLKKELGHVALSKPDTVEATSQMTIRFKIYPLYAFQDQPANGDYYLVTAQSTIENAPMYLGSFTNKHGGVKTHLCAYIFREYHLDLEFKDGIKPLFDVTPNPSTSAADVAHTEGMEWNIGGSLTGGIEGATPSAALSLNGGVSFSNSTTVTYPEIIIKNNSTADGKVSYIYELHPDMSGYIQGFTMHPPAAEIVKSNTDMSGSWVWRVKDVKDNDSKTSFSVKVSPDLTYSSMRFYSSVADANIVKWTDAIASSEKTFTLNLAAPNRTPTGSWCLKNTFTGGEYLTAITLYDSSDTGYSKPLYSFTRNVAPGEEFTTNLPTGKYNVTFSAGPDMDSMKPYKSVTPVIINRAEQTVSNASFNMEFK